MYEAKSVMYTQFQEVTRTFSDLMSPWETFLFLASRNLAHVLVVEPRHADPLSLVHYKKVLVTKAAVAQIEELLK